MLRRRLVGLVTYLITILSPAVACTVYEFTDEGFSRNVLPMLHAYPLYTATNKAFYLYDSSWPFQCNRTGGWGDFFASGVDLLPAWTPEVARKRGADCVRVKAGDVDELLEKIHSVSAELDIVAVNKLWKLQPWVQQQVNTALKGFRALKGPTVAFHMRGGDLLADLSNNDAVQNKERATPLSMMERAREAFDGNIKGGTCLILGDDPGLMTEAARAARKALGCTIYRRSPSFRKAGYVQREFIQAPLKDRCQNTVQLLVDIHLMMHADYFVGSFDSQLPRLIETLRFALLRKNKRTFADASSRREDWYETLRKYWKEQGEAGLATPHAPAA
ncbi:hypothetical protein CVIRNUC_007572 [Coccomyxa viridis]|uniref:Uncharacterized protein n=1 Tax=Coccomyxa viridis TaxID=1274662 RepID=A0AAV1IAH0_9CHLO|nr:hypothetical protein CVIRNUC_007572 [Coccomyxa viridis]